MSSHFALFEEADSGDKIAVNTKAVRYVREVKSKTGQSHAVLMFSDNEKGVGVQGDLNEVMAKLGAKEHHKHG